MNTKRKRCALIFGVIIINIFILFFCRFIDGKELLVLEVHSQSEQDIQVFYSSNGEFAEEKSSWDKVNTKGNQTLSFVMMEPFSIARIDFGNSAGEYIIKDIYFKVGRNKLAVDHNLLLQSEQKQMISDCRETEDGLFIETNGEDPFIIFNVQSLGIDSWKGHMEKKQNLILNAIICIVFDAIIFVMRKYAYSFMSIILTLCKERKLINKLSKNDFKMKFAGSYLGIVWAFVQPIITILVYWFVFQVGFHSDDIDGCPYVLWLMCGLIPWFFFSEAISSATNSLIEYAYLVKKVVFKISILPLVKVFSAFFVHIFFVTFLVTVFTFNGNMLSVITLQLIYYTICMLMLIISIVYMTSAIVVFFRDMGQIINIFLQIGMWMTPILWNIDTISETKRWIVKFNPFYYIVQGYRDSLINHITVFQRVNNTIYFWCVITVLLFVGIRIFRRLKIHFADVL